MIDDFILLAVFVGNDFLPNLPDLHIHENGLERLFEVYKKVIVQMGESFPLSVSLLYYPSSCSSPSKFVRTFVTFFSPFSWPRADTSVAIDGYINEAGTLNTRRLQQVLDEMAIWEREVFEREYADANWYKGKQRKYVEDRDVAEARGRASLGGSLSVLRIDANPRLVSRSSDEAPTCDL